MSKPYDLSTDELNTLAAAVVVPTARAEALRDFLNESGAEALLHMLSEYIALTVDVEANARAFHTMFGIVDGNLTERQAEQLNIPTIAGAIEGARKAVKPVRGMCESCAFRLGSVPSQCLPTIADAQYAIDNHANFMCHEALDEDNEPIHLCAGFAIARAAKERTA